MRNAEIDAAMSNVVIVAALIAGHVYSGDDTWLYVAISIAILASVSSDIRRGIHQAWLWIGRTMGRVISPILLTTLYVLILVPCAMVSRWLGAPSQIKSFTSGPSLFAHREEDFERHDFRQQW